MFLTSPHALKRQFFLTYHTGAAFGLTTFAHPHMTPIFSTKLEISSIIAFSTGWRF
jgi:hypothetical protein